MPPAEIVTGDVAGLEDAFADAVLKARTHDPLAPLTVLVGHVLLRPYLRRMLAARGIAHLDLRFVQAHELAEQLASGSIDAGKPRLSPAARRMLAREAAAGASDYFAAVAGREGFAEALGRLLRELELGGIPAADFARAAERCIEAGEGNESKLRELARLYAAYEERRGGFLAPPDFFAAADASRFEGELLVYGLWEKPGAVVLDLVERIAGVAPVTAFLPRTDGADDAVAAMRDRLLGAGASERAVPRTREDALASRLFPTAGEAPAHEGAPKIALVSAPDTVREVWEAARACVGWAEQGLRCHEMAVVYRNRDPYAVLVDEIFREAGIETYLHDGRPVADHPVGRRLLALIALAQSGEFARADVMEFLTETRVSPETREAYAPFRPSEWEGFTREAGILAGAAQWDERLGRLAGEKRELAKLEGQEWRLDHVDRIEVLQRFARDFDAALRAHADEGTWDEHLTFVRELASRFAVDAAPVVEALRELTALSAVDARPTFETFCRAVKDDLESRDVTRVFGEPVREFGKRGVAVVDATSLRQLRFRAVYMLGVAERAWPPPPRPDPLLLEHERRALDRHAAGSLALRTEPDGEPLTFWLDAQAARESLVVSYARAEAGRSGKHLPSFFFRRVVEALEGCSIEVSKIEASAHVRRLGAGRLAAAEIGASLSQAEYDRGLVRQAAGAAALAEDTPAFGRAIMARESRWRGALTAFDGVMSSEDALAAARKRSNFADGKPISPSRLETYATCPYRYFLQYALRIEPLIEPEAIERIDALERGSLIHAILERFLRGLPRDEMPGRGPREAHLAQLMEAAAAEEREREERGVTGRPLIWAIDRKQIEEDLVRWYDAEVKASADGLVPGAFEASFGPVTYGADRRDATYSSDDALVVRAGGRDILLQGRIDRIDWDDARTRFRVIDYKTGKVRDEVAFNGGKALQLPVYLRAAARALEMEPEQGEAQYFYVSSKGGFKRKSVSGADLAARNDEFQRVLMTIADGIDTGMFAPNPEPNTTCRWCDYRDVCDQRIDRIMQRKADDPRAAAYRAMEEIE